MDDTNHSHSDSLTAAPQTTLRNVRNQQAQLAAVTEAAEWDRLQRKHTESPSPIPPKKPCNFMTQDVIEATIQCLIAQADECTKNKLDSTLSENMILEEFGRCLTEIIEFSIKNPEAAEEESDE